MPKIRVFLDFVLDFLNYTNYLNATRTSQAWLKTTESFLVSFTHSRLFSVMLWIPTADQLIGGSNLTKVFLFEFFLLSN